VTASEFRYSLFGLQIDSGLPLPELFEGDRAKTADVRIDLEALPALCGYEPGVHALNGGALLVIGGVARYFIAEGRRILVQPDEGASERNVRLFLLGSAFGLLIHQRGLLPLHANAIEIDGKAVAFMGESGAGKSTLAAWLHDRGHRVIADDVSVIGFDAENRPIVYPGLPRLRLWQNVLEASGRDPSNFPLSFEGDETYDKRDVSLSPDRVTSRPSQLRGIVQLRRGGSGLHRLSVMSGVESVFDHTYRGQFVVLANSAQEHWTAALRLVQTVPVFIGSVDLQLDHLDACYEPFLLDVTAALRSADTGSDLK